MKKDKSHIVRFCVVAMSIILILATAFIFLAFRTDYIFNIDAESTIHSAYFDRTSVSTVIEEIDRVEGGDGVEVPTVPGENPPGIPQIPTTDGWYANLDVSVPTGTELYDLDENDSSLGVKVYNGLPWAPTGGTYIFYSYKAKEDIYDIFSKAGVTRGTNSSKVVNSSVSGYDRSHKRDDITCLVVCDFPAMVDRGYYPSLCNVRYNAPNDESNMKYNIKMACVVVEAGKSKADQSNYLYIPCIRGDAKAHTWFGGVVQTNVHVQGENSLQIAVSNNGSSYTEYSIDESKDLTTTIKEVNQILNDGGYDIGAWYPNEIESYNLKGTNKDAMNKYDVVGWVVYPWPLPQEE